MKNAIILKAPSLFCLVFICMLHMPFSFAESAIVRWHLLPPASVKSNNTREVKTESSALLYNRLNLDVLGLTMDAYCVAVEGFEKLKATRRINNNLLTIIDFSKSATKKRLFVIDMENGRLLFNTYVSHGQNSGSDYATRFSNIHESFQSSLGFYETADTYIGRNGYSMQLIGLEKGINDKADDRAIVMHGAAYVSEHFIRSNGHLGRSWGCPAIPEKLCKPLINTIRNGSCLFIYAPNKNYLKKSRILNH